MKKSVINWKTGTPTRVSKYIIRTHTGNIAIDFWTHYRKWTYYGEWVKEWCPVSEFEDYDE